MGKLTCGCLNVKIHTKRSDLTAATPAQLGLSSDFVEGFFSLQITDAPLDLEGLRIEQPCLVKQKSVGEWIVNRCHNCDMYTHATRATHGTSRVLVNCSLKNDPNIQERLETSADFSPLFKIVLPNQIDNRPMGTVGVQSDRYDQVETTLKSIQERLNSYISSEEAAVENRIREYQQQQKAAFAELQSKARRDKNAMINLVLSAQQEELNDSGNTSPLQLSTQSSQTSVTSPMSITSTSSESNTTQVSKVVKSSKTDFSFLKQPNVRMSETAGVKNKRTFFPAKPGHGNDDELFDMEGLHDMDDVRPFYNSDDENDTDDSNSLNDEGIVPHVTNSNQRQLYSSSVPISVPSWTDYRQRNSSIDEDDEEDDRVPPPNPENMAASISALARSVHTDTSDIFGERPRRKVSVLDMGRR